MASCSTVTYTVEDDGQFPNCSIGKLPLLIYRAAFEVSGSSSDLANHIENTFAKNGFPPQWRFGLYDYPHYHSITHEVLGVFQGSARVRQADNMYFLVILPYSHIGLPQNDVIYSLRHSSYVQFTGKRLSEAACLLQLLVLCKSCSLTIQPGHARPEGQVFARCAGSVEQSRGLRQK